MFHNHYGIRSLIAELVCEGKNINFDLLKNKQETVFVFILFILN
jgi:hypothetical protein